MKKRDQAPFKVVGRDEEAPVQVRPAVAAKPVRVPMTFDAWWMLTQSRLKLKPQLKEAVRKHMQARGFLDREEYNEGLSDFGIKP